MIPLDELETKECLIDEDAIPDPPDPEVIIDEEPSYLILKPETAVIEAGNQVVFKTYLVSADGTETELTTDLLYKVVDIAILVIGSTSGVATGLDTGVTIVSVEWQNLIAFSQVTVLDDCADAKVGVVVVLDSSKSMGAAFSTAPVGAGSNPFPTRFAFARHTAQRIAGEINSLKDVVGAVQFNDSPENISDLTDDVDSVANSLLSVALSNNQTNIADALRMAIDMLNIDDTLDIKAIFLFSDGENKEGDDPVEVANAFKQSGGFIAVCGVRANNGAISGIDGFALLSQIATEGLFINAKKDTGLQDSNYVSAMKSYFCAGNCNPEPGVTIFEPLLNYDGFLNWDAPSATGPVDLIGDGGTGAAAFDLLPGHGLYVDLVGSSSPWAGIMTSKDSFSFDLGTNYRISIKLAGNQRADLGDMSVKVTIGSMVAETITVTDWQQDFTEYQIDFVGDGTSQQIQIETLNGGFDTYSDNRASYGLLLDDVVLEDLDGATTILEDNFNGENQTVVPACVANDCYGAGCLTEPIPEQTPDEELLVDLE